MRFSAGKFKRSIEVRLSDQPGGPASVASFPPFQDQGSHYFCVIWRLSCRVFSNPGITSSLLTKPHGGWLPAKTSWNLGLTLARYPFPPLYLAASGVGAHVRCPFIVQYFSLVVNSGLQRRPGSRTSILTLPYPSASTGKAASAPTISVKKALRRANSEPTLHTWEQKHASGFDTDKLVSILDDADQAILAQIKVRDPQESREQESRESEGPKEKPKRKSTTVTDEPRKKSKRKGLR